jgi:hypothetical protein
LREDYCERMEVAPSFLKPKVARKCIGSGELLRKDGSCAKLFGAKVARKCIGSGKLLRKDESCAKLFGAKVARKCHA